MPETDETNTVVPCGGCGYPTLRDHLCYYCTEVMTTHQPAA
jgi:hypothetical protein